MEDNTPSILVTATFFKPKKHLLKIGPVPVTKGKTKELHLALEGMQEVSVDFFDKFADDLNTFLIQKSNDWKDTATKPL